MNINHSKYSFFDAKLIYLESNILLETKEKKIILIGDLRHLRNDYEKLEMFIQSTDWDHAAKEFIAKKSEWVNLDEYEQAIYKAKFWGLDSIGIDYQTEHYLNKPYLFSYLKVID